MTHNKFFNLAKFTGILVIMLTTLMATSCGGDDDKDEPSNSASITGTWTFEETLTDEDGSTSLMMTLIFNKDNTGSIVEVWNTESRASGSNTYSMEFSWSSTTNSNGDNILSVSYVSGDKNTELFPGSSSTALWKRQYVVTGKILNIYDGDNGVWVFNKR